MTGAGGIDGWGEITCPTGWTTVGMGSMSVNERSRESDSGSSSEVSPSKSGGVSAVTVASRGGTRLFWISVIAAWRSSASFWTSRCNDCLARCKRLRQRLEQALALGRASKGLLHPRHILVCRLIFVFVCTFCFYIRARIYVNAFKHKAEASRCQASTGRFCHDVTDSSEIENRGLRTLEQSVLIC